MACSLVGCEEWLDVVPSTELRVKDQIETVDGFNQMLNGIYINMTDRNLYGEHLMFGHIEFMAQNHHPDLARLGFERYDFDNVNAQTTIESIWSKLYNAIANVNTILDNVDQKKVLFKEDDYNILKGECLGLRAFLHFDLLRLFGQNYSEETKNNVQLPYVESAELIRYPHLSLEAVYNRIFRDLNQAQGLLNSSDPMLRDYDGLLFPKEERLFHFNLFAVWALKARAFITRGMPSDYDSAYFYSSQVLDRKDWKFTTGSEISNGNRLMNDELIWVLNVSNLRNTYNTTFDGDNALRGYRTAQSADHNGADRIFEINSVGAADFRYLLQMGPDKNDFSNYSVSLKYKGNQERRFLSSVPMFRMSEMVLTKAESILSKNRNETIGLLNELLRAREVVIPDTLYTGVFNNQLQGIIIKEYRKELFMEGQTFFIYKRLGFKEIPSAESLTENIEMIPENYIFPLPFDELELGNR